jgi:uncharacterized protein YgiM (DUF1202 family)
MTLEIDALTLPHMAHGTAICTAERQNVRAEPNTTAHVLGTLRKDELVTVWAQDSDWLIVQSENGLTGWAAAQYLKVSGELVP